jgi:hypothetical protein
VKGASSGTLNLQVHTERLVLSAQRSCSCSGLQAAPGTYTLKGSLGSDVRVILKVTLDLHKTGSVLV